MGIGRRLTWLATASLALSATGLAYAQQTPPQPAAPPEAAEEEIDESDDIVVLAEPGDQVRIDRRTYTLRDDPAAQSTDMFEVLGKVPAVSVAPSGAVTLLGADNVTIQINGQPVPGQNLEQVLRGITGASVERIEVITNPSAQYSAAASGGIINIITRQRFDTGFSGTVQTSYDTLDSYHAGFSPTWSKGRWSISGSIGAFGGTQNSDFLRTREIFAPANTTVEEGAQNIDYSGFYASRLQVGYQIDPRRRVSVALDGVSADNEIERATSTSDSGGLLSDQLTLVDNDFDNRQLIFDAQKTGEQPRQSVKFNSVLQRITFSSGQDITIEPDGDPLQHFLANFETESVITNSKLDFEQPVGEERFLTFGAGFDTAEQDIENTRETVAGPPAIPDFDALLEGVQQTAALYGTFQFRTGDWTWLPGVRGESYRREVVSGGIESDTKDERVFPSLHIRRSLGSSVELDVSYTQRIQRPGFQQLDPSLRFIDVDRALSGNPDLEPAITDAYEANLTYQRNGASFGLTFYDRITTDVFSPFVEVNPDGIIVQRPVNAGESEQRGLQAILRGPIGDNWRYSLTANLLNREFDVLNGVTLSSRSEFEYDGVAQIDYSDEDQSEIGADQVQLEVRFQGPRHTLQSDFDEFIVANATWRRRLTPQLFGVVAVQDIFSSQDQIQETLTPDYFERSETQSPGARLRLALTYQFGAATGRPPPPDQPMGPQIPGGG
jgi:outer membrane receptor protein involved in Fe transport